MKTAKVEPFDGASRRVVLGVEINNKLVPKVVRESRCPKIGLNRQVGHKVANFGKVLTRHSCFTPLRDCLVANRGPAPREEAWPKPRDDSLMRAG